MSADPGVALPRPARDPVVWVWAAASFLSFAGDYVWTVGLAWAAVHVASPAVAGVVLGVGTVPRALLILLGGSIADRHDTRRVLVVCDALRVVVLAGGAVAWQSGAPRVATLLIVAVLFGAADAIYGPASGTLPRQMVRPEDLAQLGGLFQVTRRLAAFAGAALGGVLAATFGLATAMVLDAATFLVIGMVIVLVLRPRFPVPRDCSEPTMRAIRRGLRYVRDDHVVRTLVITLSGLNVFVGPALAIGVALRVSESHWGAGLVGAAEAAVGVGAAVGAMLAMRSSVRFPGRAGFSALVLQGLAIAGTGVPRIPVLLGSAALIGLTAGYASVLLSATFVRMVRPDHLGRTQSIQGLADFTLLPLATPLFGWLAHVSSVTTTAAVFGAGMALLSAYGATRAVIRDLTVLDTAEVPAVSSAGRTPR